MTISVEHVFDRMLWLAGAGHLLILVASFQVPSRLHWKQDLAGLLPFNRKLLWVQSGFTVLTIIAFAILTLALHAELLHGDRAALGLAAFIASGAMRRFCGRFVAEKLPQSFLVIGNSMLLNQRDKIRRRIAC